MHNQTLFSLVLVVILTVLHPVLPPAPGTPHIAHPSEIQVAFRTVAQNSRVLSGSATGDITGTVTFRFHGPASTTPLSADLVVAADAPVYAFQARLTERDSSETGTILLTGVITEGWLQGDLVSVEGVWGQGMRRQFRGTIRVVPRLASSGFPFSPTV